MNGNFIDCKKIKSLIDDNGYVLNDIVTEISEILGWAD